MPAHDWLHLCNSSSNFCTPRNLSTVNMTGSIPRIKDIETDLDTYDDGYPGLARWMAQDPDNEP
jgi:hypothetical protein